MLIETVKKWSTIERFKYWIAERESIRIKKESGQPRPWTDDTILDRFRFCNVIRADDKVSKWLLENWYKPYYNHPNMLAACAIARFFNKPSTLEQITDLVFWDKGPQLGQIQRTIRKAKLSGPVFNGAYIVSGQGDGGDKVETVLIHIQKLIQAYIVIDSNSMQNTHSQLCECSGFASFMAGQVVADLRHATVGRWLDRNDWAPMGPGSRRGLNRINGDIIDKRINPLDFVEQLKSLAKLVGSKLPVALTSRMELHDWQNCLCETDKYNRVLNSEGTPKQIYRG